MSFEPDHFPYLLTNFAENPGLGVGGSPFKEGSLQYDYRFSNVENVWGDASCFGESATRGLAGINPLKAAASIISPLFRQE